MVRFLVIGVFAALCAVGAAQQLNAFGDRGEPRTAAVATTSDSGAATSTYGEAQVVKSPDGHFWVDAEVNGGHPVHFLIDTGATAVTLTASDARSLGIDPSTLDYRYTVMTANGPAHAAPVKLAEISVDHAEVENVQAMVIDQGLPTSLLGMTYLGRLAKFEATPDTLVLRS